MNTAIWKYEIPIGSTFRLDMPKGAIPLTVALQGDQPCLWAIVQCEAPREPRQFVIRGTGHFFDGYEGEYVGTFQMLGGALVYHVFTGTDAA